MGPRVYKPFARNSRGDLFPPGCANKIACSNLNDLSYLMVYFDS